MVRMGGKKSLGGPGDSEISVQLTGGLSLGVSQEAVCPLCGA